jgi:hypothetical protein
MADRVPNAARAGYAQAVRDDRSVLAEGHPGFDILPAGERSTYMVLRHSYPANGRSFGYDLYDPAQRYRAGVSAVLFKENCFEQLGGIVQGILAHAAVARASAPRGRLREAGPTASA